MADVGNAIDVSASLPLLVSALEVARGVSLSISATLPVLKHFYLPFFEPGQAAAALGPLEDRGSGTAASPVSPAASAGAPAPSGATASFDSPAGSVVTND